MRATRHTAVAAVMLLSLVAAGCGSKFELPTEQSTGQLVPNEGSYQVVATWSRDQMRDGSGLDDIKDLLLIEGTSAQLYLLFQQDVGVGPAPRGRVGEYKRTGTVPELVRPGAFLGLFNPTALCAGRTAGAAGAFNRVFVLDQGDTCMARQNSQTATCDTVGRFNMRITHPEFYWKVMEYDRSGLTLQSSFSDTTLAFVFGIAGDDLGHVYVSGRAIIFIPNPFDPRLTERVFQDRVYRYARGPLPGGLPDRNIIGGDWHRDPDFALLEGSGVGTLKDPRGMQWSRKVGPALYVSDLGKNWVQKMRDGNVDLGDAAYYRDEDLQGAPPLGGGVDVSTDDDGFFYVADEGGAQVLRYDDNERAFVQRVDVEVNAPGLPLVRPVAVASDRSQVYVADRATGQVTRYRRR